MERNLRIGQNEARHPLSIDQGELTSYPAAGVIAHERVGRDAELRQHSLESPRLSGRRIIFTGAAVRLSEADQVGGVTGKSIAQVCDDRVPRVPRQGEAV